jgi:hypothetical protein
MKIEIKQLRPNPFRNIGEYPISRDKVKGLVKSIRHTTFWDNILARPDPDEKEKYQIAYGHHRLTALREIHGERSTVKVDIPVRDLDDAHMLKIMANENATDWAMDTAVVTETVKAAEKFLVSANTIRHGAGPAHEIIAAFLGGVYTEEMVKIALSIVHAVDEHLVDKIAVRSIKEPTKAAIFVRAIKQSEKPIAAEKQREIAQSIRKNEVASSDVKTHVRYHGFPQKKEKEVPRLEKFLNENGWKVEELTRKFRELSRFKDDLRGLEWTVFKRKCIELQAALNELLDGKEVKTDGKKKTATERTDRRVLLGQSS